MQGFIDRHLPVWVRRLVTILPSLVVITVQFDPTRTLVLSQVTLSFGLPFAVLPLLIFTADRRIMGALTNRRLTTAAAAGVAALIVSLNIYLLVQILTGG